MKHAYLVQCHSNFEQLKLLIDVVHIENDIYVHVDRKSENLYNRLKDEYSNSANIFIIDNRVKTYWNHYSQVQASIFLMEEAVKKDYDYLSLISGSCFPIKKDSEFKETLVNNFGKEFISCCVISDLKESNFLNPYYRKVYLSRFWNISGRKDIKLIKYICNFLEVLMFLLHIRKNSSLINYLDGKDIIYGSQWFTLTSKAIKFLLKEVSEKNFLNMWKFTTSADELVFHTILSNSIFKEKIICHNLRFIHWGNVHNAPPEEINMQLLEHALKGNNFIARKFNFKRHPDVKQKLLDNIDHYV
jgi:hypothetical protein